MKASTHRTAMIVVWSLFVGYWLGWLALYTGTSTDWFGGLIGTLMWALMVPAMLRAL